MSDPARARKKIFVNSQIQGRMLTRLAVYWVVYHVVLWHAMFLYRFMHYRGELLAGGAPLSFSELYSTFALQHYSMAVCAVAVFPLIFFDMLKLTHRVAGPLVRFQNTLRAMMQGEAVKTVRLRKGDLLMEFQEVFNQYIDSLAERADDASATQISKDDQSQEASTATEVIEIDPTYSKIDEVGPVMSEFEGEERNILEELAELSLSLEPLRMTQPAFTPTEPPSNEAGDDRPTDDNPPNDGV